MNERPRPESRELPSPSELGDALRKAGIDVEKRLQNERVPKRDPADNLKPSDSPLEKLLRRH